jgi:2-oxoglutarate dehydrogenase E2 component (dihydrolipoamide succinyltransferase)
VSVDVLIPQLGESVTSGVIARWLKQDGEHVDTDEPLLELETDKATMEIPATTSGRLRIVEPQGATVNVGSVVARIEPAEAPAAAAAPGPSGPRATSVPPTTEARTAREAAGRPPAPRRPAPPAPAAPAPARGATTALAPGEGVAPMGPAVRKMVAEHGLEPGEVTGTGKGGRLTKEDVLRHLESAPEPAPEAGPTGVDGGPGAEIERVPMTTLRRRIAERLVEAQQTAAILTTFNEVDCSALLAARRRYRERFKTVHGTDLGLMSLFARAVVAALHAVPVVNARIDGDDIVYHRRVHLGIAVATPRGLVVPVVRHADRMRLADLERAIDGMAAKAREGRLVPDDLYGGTFTITNGGVFGSLLSTPILNPPQSGVLGMHKIQERPVAVDGQVVIRPMMYVALSYDHRLVDGEQAVTFLVRVKESLEDPVRMLLEV